MTTHNKNRLVRNVDGEEVNIRSAGALVVVSNLEVAGGSIQRVGAEDLGSTSVNADAEDVAGVADGVGELLANWDVANGGDDLVATGASLLHAHSQDTTGAVVQLSNRLCADAVINVNLADDSSVARVVWLLNGQRHGELVVGGVGAPAAGVALAQLGTAVLAVGRGNTASV